MPGRVEGGETVESGGAGARGDEGTLERLAWEARDLVGAPLAAVVLLDAGRSRVAVAGCDEPSEGWRAVVEADNLAQYVFATASPLAIDDAGEHPLTRESYWVREHGAVACASVPLLAGNEAVGALSVFATGDRHWSEADLEALGALAARWVAGAAVPRPVEPPSGGPAPARVRRRPPSRPCAIP